MTGGRLKRVAEYLEDEEAFCFTYGDGVGDVDIRAADSHSTAARQAGHGHRGAAAGPLRRAGHATATQVTRFHRKAARRRRLDQWRLLRAVAQVLDLIDGDDNELGRRAARAGLPRQGELMAFEHSGFWQPMDTLRDKNHAGRALGSRQGAVEGLVVTADGGLLARQARPCSPGTPASRAAGWRCGCSVWAPRSPASPCRRRPQPNLFELAGHRDGYGKATIATSAMRRACATIMRAAQPEIVFHLAAQPLVRASYRDPLETFATNVMGTVHVLDALRGLDSVRVAVMVTTDKVYRNQRMALALPRRRRARRPRSLQRQQGRQRNRHRQLSRCLPGRTRRGGGQRAGRQRDRRRRLVGRPPDSRCGARLAGGPTAGDPPPAGDPPLAARAGAAGRLSDPGAETVGATRTGRGLQLRPANAVRPPPCARWSNWRARPTARARCIYGDGSEGPHEAGWLALEIAKARVALGVSPEWSLGRSGESHHGVVPGAACRAPMRGSLCEAEIAAYEALRMSRFTVTDLPLGRPEARRTPAPG